MQKQRKSKFEEKFNSSNYKKSCDVNSLYGLSVDKNPEQKELIRLINENKTKIIYSNSNAGTGKTIISIAASLKLLEHRKFDRIIYLREPVEVGKSLGFLPGDVDDKYGIYLDGLKDNLDELERLDRTYGYGEFNAKTQFRRIEAMAPQFMRGRSISNAIFIIDEAQNMSLNTIKTILTRMGKNSKAILLGSTNQIDTKGFTKENNDFIKTYELLKDFDFVKRQDLIKSERSGICSMIDDALSGRPIIEVEIEDELVYFDNNIEIDEN